MRILEFVDQVLLELQKRVTTGDIAQRFIYRYIKATRPDLKLGTPRYAKQGSTSSDIVMNINDQSYIFEVKNRTTRHILIQLFSEQVRRGEPGKKIPIFLQMMGYPADLTKVIDTFRTKDKTVGFAGDPGIDSASGRLPVLGPPPPKVLATLRKYFISYLQEKQVSYFCLVTGNETTVFYTGYGTNILEAPSLPAVMFARLDTTGPAHHPKTIRACVKVRFE